MSRKEMAEETRKVKEVDNRTGNENFVERHLSEIGSDVKELRSELDKVWNTTNEMQKLFDKSLNEVRADLVELIADQKTAILEFKLETAKELSATEAKRTEQFADIQKALAVITSQNSTAKIEALEKQVDVLEKWQSKLIGIFAVIQILFVIIFGALVTYIFKHLP